MAKSKSYKDIAYQYLKEQIDSNLLLPDTHLKEVEIAETLGMSRTPVRKAMAQLAEEDYIRIEQYKGAVVAKNALNARAIVERLQFIELLTMNLFQQMQNKDVQVDVQKVETLKDEINASLTNFQLEAYFDTEFRMFTYLVSFYPNSYFRQVTLNTIQPLHELYIKESKEDPTFFRREAKDLNENYATMLEALIEKDYAMARKQARIWINQLILYQINK